MSAVHKPPISTISDRRIQVPLTADEAATHLGVVEETFSALVRTGIFLPPETDGDRWSPTTLDRTLEKLLRDGLPPGKRLPYTHEPLRRLGDETVRRHTGWRHREKSKLIGEPVNSPVFVRAWFACERAYALEQTAPTQSQPVVRRRAATSPPLAPSAMHVMPETRPLASLAELVASMAGAKPQPTGSGRRAKSSMARLPAITGKPIVPTANSSPVYLTAEEVCERWRWRITPETLANHRAMKIGLPYCKFGKIVLYRLDLIREYEQQHLVQHD